MPDLLPKLDFTETVNTLLSYMVVVGLTLVVVIFGMRLERQLIARDCENNSEIVIEEKHYICHRKGDEPH